MATARRNDGSERIFEKVKNDTFDKLNVLCSLSAELDKRMPLTGPRCLGLSETIGRKHKYAQELFKKLCNEGKCESWRSFVECLKEKEQTNSEITNITESILTYCKSDKDAWLIIQFRLQHDDVDLACQYALEGLEGIKGKQGVMEFKDQVIEFADTVLRRMRAEREQFKQAAQNAKTKLDEKDSWIRKLEAELSEIRHERTKNMEALDKSNEMVTTLNKNLTERDQKVAEIDQKLAERDQKFAEREQIFDQKLAERDQKLAERDAKFEEMLKALNQMKTENGTSRPPSNDRSRPPSNNTPRCQSQRTPIVNNMEFSKPGTQQKRPKRQ